MAGTFKAQIDEIIRKDKALLDAVVRQSVQDVIDDAQLSKQKGGRMPVKTGFLRASGKISFTGMPSGPTRDMTDKTYKEPSYETRLASFKAGGRLFFGWTAIYAGKQEFLNGFLSGAVQKWQSIVSKNVARAKE